MTKNQPSILSLFDLKSHQRKAALDDCTAIAVTAGAGSGKTRTLVGRYLRLLESGYPVRSLIAITFTEKAAREMRSRIRAEIEKWLACTSLTPALSRGERESDSPLPVKVENMEGEPDSPLPLGEGPGVRAAFWQNIFTGLDAARIGTIHSLCAEILRAHPAEAGIDPDFSVLEEGMAAALQAQAVDAAVIWAANDPQAARLFNHFKEGEIRKVLATLLQRRLDVGPRGEAQSPLQGWSAAIEGWISARLAHPAWTDSLVVFATSQAAQPDDKLELSRQDVLAAWNEVEIALENRDWDSLVLKLSQLRKSTSIGGRKDNWDPADLESIREAMRTLREYFDAELKPLLEGSASPRWDLDEKVAGALPAIRQLFDQTLDEYQKRKDEQQALDFDDLEGKAAQLLLNHPGVRRRWQRELGAVLVDEFQDTNDRQRQIVYALTGFETAHQESPNNSPIRLSASQSAAPSAIRLSASQSVDPSAIRLSASQSVDPSAIRLSVSQSVDPSVALFIVGDAKQSIYQFRGADVTVFRQVQADIEVAGGLPLDLDLTFRAHKSLLATLNALLAPILGETENPDRPYQVPFAPLRAYRQSPRTETIRPPFVEFHLGVGTDAETGRKTAAAALADRLHALHAAGEFDWGEMALLFRASTAFEVYEDALEQAGIPFVTVAGRGFYDRPEIRDVLNALAAIADPTDDLALAGLLRSPAIGLSDADLYRLRFPDGDDQSLPLWQALNADLENASSEQLQAANLIAELHALAGRASAAEVLKQVLDRIGYRTILGMVPGGSRYQRNLDKLLTDAHRSRLVNLVDFLDYIKTLRDVGTREGEAPVEAEGAVQLMTVHKAKGLEFPLVVIADAAYQPRSRMDLALLDDRMGLLLGLRDEDGNCPLAWKLAGLAQADREEAEDSRLLYVAATRAREKLIVNGHVTVLKGGKMSLRGWLGSLGAVTGLGEIELSGEVTALVALDVGFPEDGLEIACMLYPQRDDAPVPSLVASVEEPIPGPLKGREAPDLAAPLQIPETESLDEKIRQKDADPPQRVWRVIPRAKRPTGPAWVVGQLVHQALRHWRFPQDGNFEAFLTPFALEAGLTDAVEIQGTIRDAGRLLMRFQKHPLFAEIETAERYHEVPYTLPGNRGTGNRGTGDRGPGDRGIIDLLYRAGGVWVVADFKTDEVRSESEMATLIRHAGYDEQVKRYMRAITDQLGQRPRGLLVFLQVGRDSIAIYEVN